MHLENNLTQCEICGYYNLYFLANVICNKQIYITNA
jgi:hypothetical protein